MKASDFPIETRICKYDDHAKQGAVIGHSKQGDKVVAIEWDDGSLSRENVEDLITEASIALELEFKKIQEEVNKKLQAAATLILEASTLAEAQGKDLQDYDSENDDYYFDSHLLESAMGSSGWNTSSWHC